MTFTVTTADDRLSKRLEPGAPVSSRRLAALRSLSQRGLLTGITLMPVLPFIEDTEENIRTIVQMGQAAGARYILPAFGMTLRDRQRAYYYDKLDRLFPGLRRALRKSLWRALFRSGPECPAVGTGFRRIMRATWDCNENAGLCSPKTYSHGEKPACVVLKVLMASLTGGA